MTTRRPQLRWFRPDGYDAFRVEICADRECRTVYSRLDVAGTASETRPSSALPAGVAFWRVHGLVAGTVVATTATWHFTTPLVDRPIDAEWGPVFDANGDGLMDLAAAGCQPFGDMCLGYARVFYGGPAGLSDRGSTEITGTPARRFPQAVINAGDLNGDGYSDLLIYSENTFTAYPGSASGIDVARAARVPGRFAVHSGQGRAHAALGDVNGDGYADVAARGEPFTRLVILEGAPEVLVAGAPLLELTTPNPFFAVGAVGDLDGDGRLDLALGYPTLMGGTVAVHLGRASPRYVAAPDFEWSAGGVASYGFTITSAGDFNGDGHPDVAVGSQLDLTDIYAGGVGTSRRPFVRLFGGGRPGSFRATLAATGDANADGFDDIVVADLEPIGDSIASFYEGGPVHTGAPAITWRRPAEQPFGSPRLIDVSGGGSIDGDGIADVIVGHPRNGEVLIYRGRATALSTTPTALLRATAPFGSLLSQ